jgi:hypothetical protein
MSQQKYSAIDYKMFGVDTVVPGADSVNCHRLERHTMKRLALVALKTVTCLGSHPYICRIAMVLCIIIHCRSLHVITST